MQENWSSFASRYGYLYLLLLSYFSFDPFDRSLACSDPHPPNLGGEGKRQELSKLPAKI